MNEEAKDRKKAYMKAYREKNKERIREHKKQYMKEYYEKNKDRIKEYQASHYKENADRIREQTSNWKTKNKDAVNSYNRRYREAHKREHSEYIKRRRAEDAKYKLICDIRNMLNNAFNKRTKVGKTKRAEEILGCSIDFFIEYLQSKFKVGMTLENHGEWHIDHIIPLSVAETEEEVIRLNHYTNLQPLWAKENIVKRNKTS